MTEAGPEARYGAARHPFRFIASLPGPDPSIRRWQDRVREIEALGYGAASISDHVIGGWSMDVVARLAVAAVATTRLRLMPLVLNNDFRHPAFVHRAMADLDAISGGRIEIGLGAGWWRDEYEALGSQLDPPAERVERLAESVRVIKALFGPDPVSLETRHYSVRSLVGRPTATQSPRPPILIGGGADRILELAGREADIAGIFPPRNKDGRITRQAASAERTAARVASVMRAAAAAGRSSGSPRLQMSLLAWDIATSEGVRTTGKSSVASDDLLEGSPEADIAGVLAGSVADACDQLQAWRDAYGFSEIHIGSAFEAFAPIVDRLADR